MGDDVLTQSSAGQARQTALPTRRRLLSNTAVVVAGSVLQRLLAFGTTMLLARGLGAEQYGVYAFVIAYMFMLSFLVDMGLERVLARELARKARRAGELLGAAFMIRGALSVLAATLAIILAWMLQFPALTWWCVVLAAAALPLSMDFLARGFFQSRFQMHYVYLLSLPGSVALLVLTAVIIHWRGGLLSIFSAGLITSMLSVALIVWVALPKMEVVWRLDTELMRYLWRHSWELGLVFMIFLVALRADQLLLFWLRGADELAQYVVAVKIVEALSLVPESIMITVFPLLAATELSAPARFHRIYEFTVRFLIILVLPLALLITLERDFVIHTLFGPRYTEATGALVILAWWMLFSYTAAIYLGLMVVRSQQRIIGIVSMVSLVVNLGLNLYWIPRWGATGAAAANFVSSAISFALFCCVPETRNIMRVCAEQAIRPLIAIAAAAAIVSVGLPPRLRVFAALPLYGLILSILGGIGRQDWAFARTLWQPVAGKS